MKSAKKSCPEEQRSREIEVEPIRRPNSNQEGSNMSSARVLCCIPEAHIEVELNERQVRIYDGGNTRVTLFTSGGTLLVLLSQISACTHVIKVLNICKPTVPSFR